jgi:hypothetical protein
MSNKIFSTCFILSILLLMACEKIPSSESESIQILSDLSTVHDTQVGKKFAVELDECTACAPGYQWSTNLEKSAPVVLDTSYLTDFSCENCEGGTHKARFEFKALSEGNTQVIFFNLNDTLSLTVIVK